jgi:hypothetical protein
VAAGGPCARDFGARARPCVGACHLLCGRDNFELEILLYRACRICNRDYGVFDCGGVALSEDRLNLDRESDRSDLGRIAGQPEVIRFNGHAARWRRFFAVPSPPPISDTGRPESPADARRACPSARDVADGAVQTDGVVMLYVTLNQTARIFQRQRRSGRMHCPLSDICANARFCRSIEGNTVKS